MHTKFYSFILVLFSFFHLNASQFEDPRDLYIELLKKSVLNTIYGNDVNNLYQRENGLDYPIVAHTMVGLKRLNNIQECVKDVIENDIPGDLIETGVWRGGACIFMKGLLKAYQDEKRRVWVADSFYGLPPPNSEEYPEDKMYEKINAPELIVSMEQVMENFSRYDLLDSNVIFLKGFFKDTLPKADIQEIAVLRLDGDMYESTMDALENLYPKVSINGYIIIDDYGAIPACRNAVSDYRKKYQITEEIVEIDWTGVYWKKLSN